MIAILRRPGPTACLNRQASPDSVGVDKVFVTDFERIPAGARVCLNDNGFG